VRDYEKEKTDMNISTDSGVKKEKGSMTKERNMAAVKARKPFLFILPVMICLTVLTAGVVIAVNFTKDPVRAATEQDDTVVTDAPEISTSGNSSAVKEGELVSNNSGEQERLNELAEESRVYCIISSAPYFQDAGSMGSLSISNPEESRYYMQVIIKTDDGREMYVSPLLAPDEKIESDYLTNKDFDSGEYHCYAYFNYYADTDSASYLGSMCAEINVVID